MEEPTKRDAKGRWLPGSSGMPVAYLVSAQISRTTAAGLRAMEPGRFFEALPPDKRVKAEESLSELTRGRLEKLPPEEQRNARGIIRDEILGKAIEAEVFASKKRKLVNKRSGKVVPWVETLVKLEESLSRRRRELGKILRELEAEPKSLNPLSDYLARRSEPEIPISSESPVLEAGNGADREDAGTLAGTLERSVPFDSGVCQQCGKELPARPHRDGSPRRFCSTRCRKAAWKLRSVAAGPPGVPDERGAEAAGMVPAENPGVSGRGPGEIFEGEP